jgi:hypothetical protein
MHDKVLFIVRHRGWTIGVRFVTADLTYFLKVIEVKVQNGTNIGMFHYSLT